MSSRIDTNKQIILKPSRFVNKDLIPTKSKERIIGWSDFIWLWFGMAAQMGVFLLGASFVGGLTFFQAIVAILISNLGIAIVLIFIGDIGIEHGINFSTYIRAPFGYFGSYLPLIIRTITAVCWFGIQTYFGATAIDLALKHFTGHSNVQLWFFIFGVIQIWITAKGIKSIKIAENLAAPALLILCLGVTYIFISKLSFKGVISYPITKSISFWATVTANLSFWSTVAINIPDFTRFVKTNPGKKTFLSRNFNSILGQIIGTPIGMIIFASVGMIGAMATGYGNPVEAIYAALPNTFFIIIGLIIIILAQLSTNIAANLFAAGNILSTIGTPKISFATGVVIAGIFGMLTFPWVLIKFFLTYLPTLGAILAPVAGIMLSDYYLVRRRHLSVEDLYKKGEFYYLKGINPAAYITYILSIVIGLSFLKYSWLFSLPISVIVYFILMKLYILKKYPQYETKKKQDESYLATSIGKDWPFEIDNNSLDKLTSHSLCSRSKTHIL